MVAFLQEAVGIIAEGAAMEHFRSYMETILEKGLGVLGEEIEGGKGDPTKDAIQNAQ